MKPADAPTVCVVDDDPSVRASIQGLLKSANLRSASFRTAEEFLHSKAAGRAQPPCFGREPAWSQRSRLSARVGWSGRAHSHHLHHWSWRYPVGGEGHEIRLRWSA